MIHSTFKGERSEIPLPGETQDRLSLMYQFMKASAREGILEVPMSNGRRVEMYTYRLVEEVRVSTPAGDFDTLLSIQKAHRLLGYEPRWSWRDHVADQ